VENQGTETDGVHDLVVGYALGLLDEDERREFDSHLGGCESCRDEVVALTETSAALAYAAEGPAPPDALRGRIVDAARAERGKVMPLRRYRRPVWLASVAAAACLAIGLGLWATVGTSNGSGSVQVSLGTYGTLTVKGSGVATMDVHHLPALSSGAFYQVWVIPSHTKETLPDRYLTSGGSVRLEHKLSRGDTVAMTIEREHLRAPKGPAVFQASVST
jgi:anti-sigma-K factor RskA